MVKSFNLTLQETLLLGPSNLSAPFDESSTTLNKGSSARFPPGRDTALGYGLITPDRKNSDGRSPGSKGNGGTDAPQIVISGLDEPEGPQDTDAVNVSPIDEAVNRLNSQRARGEPEDEDG